jgi:hypothetical protein
VIISAVPLNREKSPRKVTRIDTANYIRIEREQYTII